jgi:hypothetical protein
MRGTQSLTGQRPGESGSFGRREFNLVYLLVNYIFEAGVLIIIVVTINSLDGRIMGSGVLCARGLRFFLEIRWFG